MPRTGALPGDYGRVEGGPVNTSADRKQLDSGPETPTTSWLTRCDDHVWEQRAEVVAMTDLVVGIAKSPDRRDAQVRSGVVSRDRVSKRVDGKIEENRVVDDDQVCHVPTSEDSRSEVMDDVLDANGLSVSDTGVREGMGEAVEWRQET